MSCTLSNFAPASKWVPTCALCNNPIKLEKCKTDECGKAVHEECYIRKVIQLKRPNQTIVQLPNFLGHYRIAAA